MPLDPFVPLAQEMVTKNLSWLGPISFREHLAMHQFPKLGAWTYLSVDHKSRLQRSLKNNGIMVFRLGGRKGKTGTSFGLAKPPNGLDDFFLLDDECFGKNTVEEFDAKAGDNHLFGYLLIPNLTETSLVNLAFSSGILGRVLDIDTSQFSALPATGQTECNFSIRPHPAVEVEWQHHRGQVEVDALFVENKRRKRVFIMESKVGAPNSELAKHKLVYPVEAVAPFVPDEFEIVPIYLKIEKQQRDLIFHFAICTLPDVRRQKVFVSELQLRSSYSLRMKDFAPAEL